jgi:kinesin family member 20
MIVNVNPYDTGYDENSHVMKFAALAREVYTTPAVAPVQRLPAPPSPSKPAIKSQSWKTREPLRDPEIVPFGYTRKVRHTLK